MLPKSLLCGGLLTTASGLTTVQDLDRPITASGLVASPDASFKARTYQAATGDLVVQVNMPSLRNLTIELQTLRVGAASLARYPFSQHALAP